MIRITIEVEEDNISEEKLSSEEIECYLKEFEKSIDRHNYIYNPRYHHIVNSQRNALKCGRKDWQLFGYY